MKHTRYAIVLLPIWLASCATPEQGTLAELRNVKLEIKEVQIEGGIEKAMESYQRFLEETPDSALTPEAIRRLADLKVEREYGTIPTGRAPAAGGTAAQSPSMQGPQRAAVSTPGMAAAPTASSPGDAESDMEFERRATASQQVASESENFDVPNQAGSDLIVQGAVEAIELYRTLLEKYPLYERNDQVLYQMSRAHEELGQVEEAMSVMDRLVREYPRSRYIDEVQFRRGEYFFTRKKYLDAEEAYQAVVVMGPSSSFYELALYKMGWALYKQEMYEDALHRFVALLDHKVSTGYDFEQTEDDNQRKRIEDTYRVISFSFSNLGGPDSVVEYFSRHGKRSYEDGIYSNLGEYYLEKRRYHDAAGSYKAFVANNPFHKVSPHFQMRVIDIYMQGGFPRLVVESKKEFAPAYGLKAAYWNHFDVEAYPEVLVLLKANLKDLANHYHALYQDPRVQDAREENFAEAMVWYREYLASFPKDEESPAINYQLADLLLEHKAFGQAAFEYERTAYDYPAHEKSSEAGYAAVYAHRENLKAAPPAHQNTVKREVVRSSLRFADAFPGHESAPMVLGAAADDLYALQDYQPAVTTARRLIATYPHTEQTITRSAWLVVAHSSFELAVYEDAEVGYINVLQLTSATDESREGLVDNLAASIYKQGERANAQEDYRTAATHFLRVGTLAPTSKIRPSAEYDASAALIRLEDWDAAANVLAMFRQRYPGHELQGEVTKKMAFVYKEAGKLALAASEFERIETESNDDEVRREALLVAAELYEEAGDPQQAISVYRRYIGYFPSPAEQAVDARFKVAGLHKSMGDRDSYMHELRAVVDADGSAGRERTQRTRYLAAKASLELAQPLYEEFSNVKLVKPFEENLRLKQERMRSATAAFNRMLDYEVGEVTAAATYFLAEIYYQFSRALMESERPDDLNALEFEQYELALEEQAYPFEERAIGVHEKNLELISIGVYNEWVDKSIAKLAALVPARYAKQEESTGFLGSIGTYNYYLVTEPAVEAGADSATPTTLAPEDIKKQDEQPTLPVGNQGQDNAIGPQASLQRGGIGAA